MPKRTPPFKAYDMWTTAKFFGFIRSGLREKFNRWPPKYLVLGKAVRSAPILNPDGSHSTFKSGKKVGERRYVKEYKCNECKEWHKQKDVQVDHIIPAGSLKTFNDLPAFTERLFCGVDNLQVMCKICHNIKTKQEKAGRM